MKSIYTFCIPKDIKGKERQKIYQRSYYKYHKGTCDILWLDEDGKLRGRSSFDEDRRKRLKEWRNKNPEKYLLQKARGNARHKNREFNLSLEDIKIPEKCPALNVLFEFDTPYAPSIDRIDSSKGYTKDNIQIISRKANLMKSDATPEELKRFAEWASRSTS